MVEEKLLGPNQQPGIYGYFAPVDCVFVVPLWFEDGVLHTALVEQWRQPIREHSWEVPCGRLEAGENPQAAAQRELMEECGLEAGQLLQIGAWRHSDARVAGLINTFVALDLRRNHSLSKDDSEADLHAFRLSWDQAMAAIDSGAISQVGTLSALLRAAQHQAVQDFLRTP